MLLKENLEQAVEKESVELDEWLQLIGSSTVTEMEDLATSLTSVSLLTPEERGLLRDFQTCTKKLQGFSHLGLCLCFWQMF